MKDGKLYGLVIADIHYGKKDDVLLNKNLDKFFFPKIYEENYDIDYVIVAGDLFDRIMKLTEMGSIFALNFINHLVELAIQYDFVVRILKGTKTHDYNQLNNFKSLEAKHFPRFRVIETVEEEEIFENVTFLYVPEEYMDNPTEYYSKYFDLEEGVAYDMMFFHGTFDFVGFIPDVESERHIKHAPVFSGEKISKIVYGKAIGGHIHNRMIWKNIEYTGSFDRFSFGDTKPKGFLEVFYDLETLECTTNFIENTDAPIYVTFNMDDFEGTLEEKIQTIKELKDQYENIRIIAKSANEEDVASVKKLTSGIDNVKLDIKRQEVEDSVDEQYVFIINREYDVPTTVQKYIALEDGKTIPLEEINEILSEEEAIVWWNWRVWEE